MEILDVEEFSILSEKWSGIVSGNTDTLLDRQFGSARRIHDSPHCGKRTFEIKGGSKRICFNIELG